MMNRDQFDQGMRDANRKVVAESTEAIRSAALGLYSDLTTPVSEGQTYGAPVASGRLVASMRLEINGIDSTVEPADPGYEYPQGKGPRELPPRTIRNRAIARVAAKLRTFKLGDTIFISNSVPYIRRIEEESFSWQAPGGVFAPTVRRWIRKLENLNLRINRV